MLSLPEPPQQGAPWPAADLLARAPDLAALIDATRALLAQGLADPRGCSYRQVTIEVGSLWRDDAQRLYTRGWVLPCETAVAAWNGLVYPIARLGGPADPARDIAAMRAAEAEREQQRARDSSDYPFARVLQRHPEPVSAAATSCQPLKAAMLLAAGELESAREAWDAWSFGMRTDVNRNADALAAPYMMLATDWVWAAADRGVCAHLRGDDATALACARLARRIGPAVEAEADRRGYRRIYSVEHGFPWPRMPFGTAAYDLLADQERRAASADPAPADEPDDEISALIARLEDARSLQGGQPGWTRLESCPQVKALIAIGAPAVEPLLVCLAGDTRRTRSVRFWREHRPGRTLVGVWEAAYIALREILGADLREGDATRDLSHAPPADRRALAERAGAYWRRFGRLSPLERWAAILADDHVTPERWRQAARQLVAPPPGERMPGELDALTFTLGLPGAGHPRPLAGASLRADPERRAAIAGDMARRAASIPAPGSEGDLDALWASADVALALADWDLQAAGPALASRWAAGLTLAGRVEERELERCAQILADLALARIRSGDERAAADFAAWIRDRSAQDSRSYDLRHLAPIWALPTHPALAALADWIWSDPGSPWGLPPDPTGDLRTNRFTKPECFGPAAVRRRFRAALDDLRVIGDLQLREDSVCLNVNGRFASLSSFNRRDEDPPPDYRAPFRRCDLYARALRYMPGAPGFVIWAPQAARDDRLALCRGFLDASLAG